MLSPFGNPAADVVEVRRGDELDLVALIGAAPGVAFVSITGAIPVRVRRRDDSWRCDVHDSPPQCRHIEDAMHATDHLARELSITDRPTNKEK